MLIGWYNANKDAMDNASVQFDNKDSGETICILDGIRELGKSSANLHKNLWKIRFGRKCDDVCDCKVYGIF
jgi:UDP-N-acetylmuramyl pentapeptide synthase